MSHTGVHVERQLCVRCFTTSAESRCFQLLLPVGAAVDDITCCLRDRLGLPPQFPLELPEERFGHCMSLRNEDLSQQGELELQVPTAALLRLVPPSQAETELRPADAAPLRPAALDVPASTVLSTELAHERALMAWTGGFCSARGEMGDAGKCSSSGIPGLHGLLLQGMVEPRESDFITVPMPSLEHQAQLEEQGEVKDPALLASLGQKRNPRSRGTLRWAEIRFKSVEQARRRAAILFLCSWSALHREAVPFVPKSMIQNVEVGAAVLRFWKVYGLTWGIGEKTSSHKLRTCGELGLNLQGNRVHACPCCGFRVVSSCFPAQTHKELLMETP
eukprot:g31435.t2